MKRDNSEKLKRKKGGRRVLGKERRREDEILM